MKYKIVNTANDCGDKIKVCVVTKKEADVYQLEEIVFLVKPITHWLSKVLVRFERTLRYVKTPKNCVEIREKDAWWSTRNNKKIDGKKYYYKTIPDLVVSEGIFTKLGLIDINFIQKHDK